MRQNAISILLVVIGGSITLTQKVQPQPKITTSSGAYFVENKNARTYEKTIPILYEVNLKDEDMSEEYEETLRKAIGKDVASSKMLERLSHINTRLNMIKQLQKLNRAIVKEFEVTRPARTKRGIQFIGDFYTFCCNVMTLRQGNDIIDNQYTLKDSYEKLKSTVLDHHAELLNISKTLNDISTTAQKNLSLVEKNLNTLREDLSSIVTEAEAFEKYQITLEAITSHTLALQNKNGILIHLAHSCKNHHLPGAIVEERMLKIDLEKVKKAAIKSNLQPVIEEADMSLYYTAQLTNCYLYEEQMQIEVKIPLKSKGSLYRVYDFIPLHFKTHDGKLCMWDQSPVVIVHEEINDSIRLISGSDMDLCEKNDPLCYLPQNRGVNNQGTCARALFLKRAFEEVIRTCSFKCDKNHGEIITRQIGYDLFAVTNPKSPMIVTNMIEQNKTEIAVNETHPGSILITVPCALQIEMKNREGVLETIVPTGFPCKKNERYRVKVEHYLPLAWTNFKGMHEDEAGVLQNFYFHDMQTVYNASWEKYVPYTSSMVPLHQLEERLKDVELKQPNLDQESFSLVHLVFFLWDGLLSLGILAIVYAQFKSVGGIMKQNNLLGNLEKRIG